MAPPRREDLRQIAKGAMRPAEVAAILRRVAAALERMHAEGRAHRDLRPESIVLIEDDSGSQSVELREARAAETSEGPETRKAKLLAMPLYLTPEQVRGDKTIGPAADVHALAHIAFTLLTGEAYFQVEKEETGAVFELLARIVGGAFEPPSIRAARRRKVSLPAGFDAWFSRAAAPDPADRFKSAQAAADAFAELVGEEAPARPASSGGGGLWTVALAAGGIAFALAIGMLVMRLARVPGETDAATPTAEPPQAAPSATPATAATTATATAGAPAEPSAAGSAAPAVSAAPSATPSATPASTATASAAPSAAPAATASAAADKPATESACAAALFPADTFTATPDFAFLCTETDPRRGAATMKTRVVLGSTKTLTEGKLEWGTLGWYEMAAFAVIRARCCASPEPLKLPPLAGDCALAERLNELTGAAAAAPSAEDEKLRAAMEGFTKSATCMQRGNAFGDMFPWRDQPGSGAEAAFRKTVARAAAARH
jgi:hypothetical protein